jgi:hypothetical protein
MPLYFDNTKIMTPQYNGTNLSVVKIDGQNVFKKGNVNFTYNLTSKNAGLNSYASDFYVRIKNERTGVTKTVGGQMGTTSVSVPAMDGDTISFSVQGYYEGGYLKAVAPLQGGLDAGATIVYPLNDADISFNASLMIDGYYDGEFHRWVCFEGVTGTVTANYYIDIQYDDEY